MTPDERGQKRTIKEEILRNFGAKVTPFRVRQEGARRERENRDVLTKLLEEEEVIRTFTRGFIPKQ